MPYPGAKNTLTKGGLTFRERVPHYSYEYLRGVMESVNSEFVPSYSKKECASIAQVFVSFPKISTGVVALEIITLLPRTSALWLSFNFF